MCAGRIGQLINLQSLANDASVSPKTAKSWLSILESCYVIYQLQPHYKKFNKGIAKSPKLYFYYIGLACSLLNIENSTQVNTHYLKGGLFENFVRNEFLKIKFNSGKNSNLYFWQSKEKKEIDIVVEKGDLLLLFEIKSSKTSQSNLLDNLQYWKKLNNMEDSNLLNVIYEVMKVEKLQEGILSAGVKCRFWTYNQKISKFFFSTIENKFLFGKVFSVNPMSNNSNYVFVEKNIKTTFL